MRVRLLNLIKVSIRRLFITIGILIVLFTLLPIYFVVNSLEVVED